jgi:Na+/melibiose symporter-like transporter
MNTTRDCTCNRLFLVITMLRNLNMHIEIYLCSWLFDSSFFSGMAYVYFIYRIYEHPSCFAYYVNPTFRLVYIGVIFLSHELIITCIFIYVWVCLFLCSAHIELGHWKVKYSYLRLRDWFKNKLRKIEKKIDVNFYLNVLFRFRICTLYVVNPLASHVSFYL